MYYIYNLVANNVWCIYINYYKYYSYIINIFLPFILDISVLRQTSSSLYSTAKSEFDFGWVRRAYSYAINRTTLLIFKANISRQTWQISIYIYIYIYIYKEIEQCDSY